MWLNLYILFVNFLLPPHPLLITPSFLLLCVYSPRLRFENKARAEDEVQSRDSAIRARLSGTTSDAFNVHVPRRISERQAWVWRGVQRLPCHFVIP